MHKTSLAVILFKPKYRLAHPKITFIIKTNVHRMKIYQKHPIAFGKRNHCLLALMLSNVKIRHTFMLCLYPMYTSYEHVYLNSFIVTDTSANIWHHESSVLTSVFVIAETSVGSPRKQFICIIKNNIFRIKASKKYSIYFWNQNHWSLPHTP